MVDGLMRKDILKELDGPMLKYSLQLLMVDNNSDRYKKHYPDWDRLSELYERF